MYVKQSRTFRSGYLRPVVVKFCEMFQDLASFRVNVNFEGMDVDAELLEKVNSVDREEAPTAIYH